MTYEETIELEQNVKFKNQADVLYSNFVKHAKFNLSDWDFSKNRYKIRSEEHNSAYIHFGKTSLTYQGRFLHNTYDLTITPSAIFSYLKADYEDKNNRNGFGHLKSYIERITRDAELGKK